MTPTLRVGVIVASTRVLAMDYPVRIGSSTMVGPHRGLAPKCVPALTRSQSGELDVTGRTSMIYDGQPVRRYNSPRVAI